MIKINLAPARRGKAFLAVRAPRLGLLFGPLYAVLIAGIAAYWFPLSMEAGRLQSEVVKAEAELASLRAVIAEGNRFKREKEELERRVGIIDLIARNQARPVYLMEAVAEAIPKDLWLTTMEEKQSVLRLAGSAFSSTAVADFMATLRRSGKFVDVDLIMSRHDPTKIPRVVTFEISCSVRI